MRGPSIIDTVRALAERKRIAFTSHARDRMWERNVDEEDVLHALRRAESARAQLDERWRVLGHDREGEELTVVLVIEDGLMIITVF